MKSTVATSLGCWICSLGLLAGCSGSDGEYKEVKKGTVVPELEHEHTAPHSGHLVELGKHEFNAELVYAADAKKITLYILDAHAEKAKPIEQPDIKLHLDVAGSETEITLAAAPQSNDPQGQSSRFESSGELHAEIKSVEDLKGHFDVTIGGKEYEGQIAHDHEHEDHNHAKTEEYGREKRNAEPDPNY